MKSEKRILIAFILNISFSLFELIGGFFTNSVAIVSDAIHDFSDAISIGISYFLEKKSKKKPDSIYTFGYMRYSLLGAVITNLILIVGSCLVIYHAVLRLFNPSDVLYDGMIFLASIGVIINFLAAYFTKGGHSLNQKAVNLHMLEDVLGWVLVLIGAIVIKFSKITIIDPLMSIGVAIYILIHAIKSFKEVLNLFLDKIPLNLNLDELKNHLQKIDGVKEVHHIHAWSIDGVNNYATMHVVVDNQDFEQLKLLIKAELKEHGIVHTTIEFETESEKCQNLECAPLDGDNQPFHHHHHH